MKKVISLILAVVCVVGLLSACGQDKTNTTSVDKDHLEDINDSWGTEETEDIENTEHIWDNDENTSEPTEVMKEAPKLSYKLAPLYKRSAEDHQYGYTTLWFALEFDALGWKATNRDSFIITNTKTGEVLNELEAPYYGGADVDWYLGYVCAKDHKSEYDYFGGLYYDTDYCMYVVSVESANDINFEDLQITANLLYMSDEFSTEPTPVELSFNAEPSDLTTRQQYIHGSTLFEIDGYYYVCDAARSGGGGTQGTLKVKLLSCIPINGTDETLANSLTGKTHLVYGPGAYQFKESGYLGKEDYLKNSEVPENCDFHIEAASNKGTGVEIGYRAKDGYTLSEADKDRVAACIPVYEFEDGFTMTFIN